MSAPRLCPACQRVHNPASICAVADPPAPPVLIEGALVLLPGGLLGRVVRLAEGGLVVDRYHVGLLREGWRSMSGVEGRPLPAGDVAAHPFYLRALLRAGEAAS